MNDELWAHLLLNQERIAHRKTKKALEKAEHDRDRYARRITFLQGRHEILAREYRELVAERNALRTGLDLCKRKIADYESKEE